MLHVLLFVFLLCVYCAVFVFCVQFLFSFLIIFLSLLLYLSTNFTILTIKFMMYFVNIKLCSKLTITNYSFSIFSFVFLLSLFTFLLVLSIVKHLIFLFYIWPHCYISN